MDVGDSLDFLKTGLIAACATASVACGGAAHQILEHPVHRPVAIVVQVSDQVNGADDVGGVAELVETVTNGLKEHGMDSEIYTAADDHPPPPRIELNVVYWSTPLSGVAAQLLGQANQMVVDCSVFLDSNAGRTFYQRFEVGSPVFSFGGQDPAAAGGEAGAQILRRLLNPPSARKSSAADSD